MNRKLAADKNDHYQFSKKTSENNRFAYTYLRLALPHSAKKNRVLIYIIKSPSELQSQLAKH
jgi:hypothetical protein